MKSLLLPVLLALSVFVAGCQTNLYVPRTVKGKDGRVSVKAIKVASVGGDAENLNVGYTNGTESSWLYAEKLSNSQNTEASGELAKDVGSSIGTMAVGIGTGVAIPKWVAGKTKEVLAKEDTSRHAAEQTTARAADANATKIGLAEIEAAAP